MNKIIKPLNRSINNRSLKQIYTRFATTAAGTLSDWILNLSTWTYVLTTLSFIYQDNVNDDSSLKQQLSHIDWLKQRWSAIKEKFQHLKATVLKATVLISMLVFPRRTCGRRCCYGGDFGCSARLVNAASDHNRELPYPVNLRLEESAPARRDL